MTPTNEQIAAVLDDAAEEIRRNGFCRWNYGSPGGKKCAAGAINWCIFQDTSGHFTAQHSGASALERLAQKTRGGLTVTHAMDLWRHTVHAVARQLTDPDDYEGSPIDVELIRMDLCGGDSKGAWRAAATNAHARIIAFSDENGSMSRITGLFESTAARLREEATS